ncbi:MAG: hypothetical protein HQ504_07655 [Rhodospirillaceae bacterium]|nr:hypothetical protein [Rhodospirillaceae bacterium]
MSENDPSEFKPRGPDRRSGRDRRLEDISYDGADRREFDRRQSIDRRGLPYGVFYKTDKPIVILYDWLKEYCIGKWGVGIEPVKGQADKKSMKVLFEKESDKENFLNTVVRGKS